VPLRPTSDLQGFLNRPSLKQLAEKYGSDKLYRHSYIENFYEKEFEGRDVKKLLEIGIGYMDMMKPFSPTWVPGSSLRMWREYFPDAEIYAIDNREDVLINEGGIHSMVCDQRNSSQLREMLDAYGCDFDVVIDDGSHATIDQLYTAFSIVPRMKKGSVYIIEDVQEPDILGEILALVTNAYRSPVFNPYVDDFQFKRTPDDTILRIRL
jgi:hypothetical protein